MPWMTLTTGDREVDKTSAPFQINLNSSGGI